MGGRRPGRASGSTNRMVVPRPGSLSAVILPPWACTRLLAIARPSPAPPESADFTNRSNTYGRSAASMPLPVSETVKETPAADGSTTAATDPPRGVWRTALDSRFASTSPIRTGSTSSSGTPSAARHSSVTPAASARARNAATASWTSAPGSTRSRCSRSTPASAVERVCRSSSNRDITAVSSRTGARCASSAGYRPSSIPSTLPRITDSGVRSSWATSASRPRRCASLASSRSTIWLKERARRRTSPGPRAWTRAP